MRIRKNIILLYDLIFVLKQFISTMKITLNQNNKFEAFDNINSTSGPYIVNILSSNDVGERYFANNNFTGILSFKHNGWTETSQGCNSEEKIRQSSLVNKIMINFTEYQWNFDYTSHDKTLIVHYPQGNIYFK